MSVASLDHAIPAGPPGLTWGHYLRAARVIITRDALRFVYQRDRFIAEVRHDLVRAVGDAAATGYTLAAPLDQCWQGLARYWKKKTV